LKGKGKQGKENKEWKLFYHKYYIYKGLDSYVCNSDGFIFLTKMQM